MSTAAPLDGRRSHSDHDTPVGNYERYSLARDNTGNPQLITYVATYASTADLPSADQLRTRARELVEEYPLLKGRVGDGRTTSPKWGVLSEKEVEQGMNGLVYDKNISDMVSLFAENGLNGVLIIVSYSALTRS